MTAIIVVVFPFEPSFLERSVGKGQLFFRVVLAGSTNCNTREAGKDLFVSDLHLVKLVIAFHAPFLVSKQSTGAVGSLDI